METSMVHLKCKIPKCRQHSLSIGRWVTARHKRTELTDQSTGLRRSRDKKMEVLRERSGNMLQDTSVIGKKIKKTDSVYNSITTATNTKVYGNVINATVKVLTGEMRLVNCVVNIQEIGAKTKSTVAAHSFTKTVTDTMAIGLQACLKERVEWSMLTRIYMKDSGMKVNATAMVCLQREMEIISKATGLTTWEKVKAAISIMTRTSCS